MFDKLPYNILFYCLLPYLQDEELRMLSALCERTNRIVHKYCLADKTSIRDLCQRGDLLIIYKRELVVVNPNIFDLICERGYVNLVRKSLICFTPLHSHGLSGACRGGHRKIVDLMISLLDNNGSGNNWNNGLESACQGGHRDIIDLMIKKGANNWNRGLEGACRGGHRDIVDLMIKKGADYWNCGLGGACRGGHRDIVDLMIEKGAIEWNDGLEEACHGGHRDIIDLMISLLNNNGLNNKGSTDDLNCGLEGACRGGHREIINLMIEKGADYWNWGLRGACEGGHREIVDWMISLLGNNGSENNGGVNDWNWGLSRACHGGHHEITKLMIEKGATRCFSCGGEAEKHL